MPTPDPDRDWPSCDDDQPGVSIRPLSQADLAALLAHLNQHHQEDRGEDVAARGLAARGRRCPAAAPPQWRADRSRPARGR